MIGAGELSILGNRREQTMAKTILFPTDLSEASAEALDWAAQFAVALGATMHVLFVEELHELESLDQAPYDGETVLESLFESLSSYTEELLARRRLELDVKTMVRRGVAAAPTIQDYAAEIDAELIVMATHGRRGIRHLLIGSVAEEVLRGADRPVLTIRPPLSEDDRTISRILVPLDLSEPALRALKTAHNLIGPSEADIELLHAVYLPVPAMYPNYAVGALPEITEQATAGLRSMAEKAGLDTDRVVTTVIEGRPSEVILEHIEKTRPDLVVLGNQGAGAAERFLVGSTTERVVRLATRPVLTVKEPSA